MPYQGLLLFELYIYLKKIAFGVQLNLFKFYCSSKTVNFTIFLLCGTEFQLKRKIQSGLPQNHSFRLYVNSDLDLNMFCCTVFFLYHCTLSVHYSSAHTQSLTSSPLTSLSPTPSPLLLPSPSLSSSLSYYTIFFNFE